MQSMTLEQLRAATDAGGVKGVTLKGLGGGFFVEIATRAGKDAVLSKARGSEPRRFGNPSSALLVLRGVGICMAQIDATHWDPEQKDLRYQRESRGQALRDAHQAAAYNQQLAGDIQASLDDPRPSLSHEEVMAQMDAEIARLGG